jgi:hypothetical protein
MADFYFNTVGEAWIAAASYVGANCIDGSTPVAGWNFGYFLASGTTPAKLQLFSSLDWQNNTWWFKDGFSYPNIPARYILFQPQLNEPIMCTGSGTDDTFVTFDHAASTLNVSFVSAIRDLTGYSLDGLAFNTRIFPGKSADALNFQSYRFFNDTDQIYIAFIWINQTMLPDNYGIQLPIVQSFGNQPIINVSQVVSIPPATPPLDLDVSVNQGQAILSVVSRTTTMIP